MSIDLESVALSMVPALRKEREKIFWERRREINLGLLPLLQDKSQRELIVFFLRKMREGGKKSINFACQYIDEYTGHLFRVKNGSSAREK